MKTLMPLTFKCPAQSIILTFSKKKLSPLGSIPPKGQIINVDLFILIPEGTTPSVYQLASHVPLKTNSSQNFQSCISSKLIPPLLKVLPLSKIYYTDPIKETLPTHLQFSHYTQSNTERSSPLSFPIYQNHMP